MAASKWISNFLDEDILEDDLNNTDTLFWDNSSHSLDDDSSKGDSLNVEKSRSRKRARNDSPDGAGLKACREKMRRDRLNDRFMELSAVLQLDKPLKTDKASILKDATRILCQLRTEVQQLKDANVQLQSTIQELKAEKNELRDEKHSLKIEKERLEKQLHSAEGLTSGCMAHPVAMHPAMAVYSSQSQAFPEKNSSFPGFQFPTMSQWMPQSTVDISKDHVLRPPVA